MKANVESEAPVVTQVEETESLVATPVALEKVRADNAVQRPDQHARRGVEVQELSPIAIDLVRKEARATTSIFGDAKTDGSLIDTPTIVEVPRDRGSGKDVVTAELD